MEHLLKEKRRFPPPSTFSAKANLQSLQAYEKLYRESIENPDQFWLEQSETLEWFKAPTKACSYEWNTQEQQIHHRWFEDGMINTTLNCLDRHAKGNRAKKTAILWQGEEDSDSRAISYQELLEEVSRFANLLKAKGIQKGDRVCLYMPMVPELVFAMLGCARIGAIHSIVFGGFSHQSLANRINDSSCKCLITANGGKRGGKQIPLKEIVDKALKNTPSIDWVCVVKSLPSSCHMEPQRDFWYHEVISDYSTDCPAEPLHAEDPLFILYTSGSTGKPKGVVHTQAGYLLYASLTHHYVFDHKEEDIFWCTADCGWVTGHSYVVYGPLCNGATTLMFEGIPTFPDAGRFWQIIEKHKVTVFYTAPTAIRSLIRLGPDMPSQYNLSPLRLLGTVGEPINPEAWIWYYEKVGQSRCPIVDTWWQTETGGIMITPLPGCHTLKPSSALRPFFGIQPVILREDGTPCAENEGGLLCIKSPWPGMMRTTWGSHAQFISVYFTKFNDLYFTGDSAVLDEEGDYWLLGRVDDVINISGHRLGTAEIESALVGHPTVVEAAVVPIPHEIKGQGVYAFITLKTSESPNSALKEKLREHVKEQIGKIATIDKIRFTPDLPKTRSGKIMRRILKKIAVGELTDLGDISTLANKEVIEHLT